MITFNTAPSLMISLKNMVLTQRTPIQVNQKFKKLHFRLTDVKINKNHLKSYQSLCLLSNNDLIPSLYPHIIASKLHMYLFSHADFPINLIGAVHKYNVVQTFGELNSNNIYELDVKVANERYFSKGLEFDVETLLILEDKIVWKEVSTYLKRQHFDLALTLDNSALGPIQSPQIIAEWKISANTAKKYAFLSNDYNPIHISKLGAKLFGFSSYVAHGMCSAAQSLGRIEKELSNSTIKTYFKGPCFLNKRVSLFQDKLSQSRFDLKCEGNSRPVICLEIQS